MTQNRGLFETLRARGEEAFARLSSELMSNPQFMKAMQGALRGKEVLDQAAGRALKSMNVPTRTEFKRALSRIEHLEKELAAVKAASAARPAARRRQAGGAASSK